MGQQVKRRIEMKNRHLAVKIISYVILSAGAVMMVLPFYWMIITAYYRYLVKHSVHEVHGFQLLLVNNLGVNLRHLDALVSEYLAYYIDTCTKGQEHRSRRMS